MRKSLFLVALFLIATLSFNGVAAQNIAQGVRVVVIDAGHGGPKFPGAHYRGVYEKDLNLQIALKLGALIEKEIPQLKVVYTRKTDKQFSESLTQDLQARADIANKAGGDLFISIHTNAAASASARGVETLIMGESPLEKNANERALYYNNQEELLDMSNEKTAAIVRAYIQNLQFTYGEYSEAMARLVQKHYVKSGRHNRGVKRPAAQSALRYRYARYPDRDRFPFQFGGVCLYEFGEGAGSNRTCAVRCGEGLRRFRSGCAACR